MKKIAIFDQYLALENDLR